jgi:isoquinoline 1-oxidoreductase beta subunit
MWAAIKGRELVTVEWDESEAETRGSETILSDYKTKAGEAPTVFARNDGDAEERARQCGSGHRGDL